MILQHRFKVGATLIGTILLGGCRFWYPDPDKDGTTYFIPGDNVYFPSQMGDLRDVFIYKTDHSIDSIKFVYYGKKPKFKKGYILLGMEKTGYMVKIKDDPTIRGDTIIVKTKLADLSEAIREAYIDTIVTPKPLSHGKYLPAIDTTYTTFLKGKYATVKVYHSEGIMRYEEKNDSFRIVIELPNFEIFINGSDFSAGIKTETLRIVYNLKFEVALQVRDFKIKYFKVVTISNKLEQLVRPYIYVKGEIDLLEDTLPIVPYDPFVAIVVAPPLVFTVGFGVNFGVDFSFSGELKWNFLYEYTESSKSGAEWRDGSWHPISQNLRNLNFKSLGLLPTIDGEAEISPFIQANIVFALYALPGIKFAPRGYLYFSETFEGCLTDYEEGWGIKFPLSIGLPNIKEIPSVNIVLADFRNPTYHKSKPKIKAYAVGYIEGFGPAFMIFDVGDPTNPYVVSYVRIPAIERNLIKINDNLIYTISGNGICVVNPNNIINPIIRCDTSIGIYRGREVRVSGNYMYFSGIYRGQSYNLMIVDISNPIYPRFAGGYRHYWFVPAGGLDVWDNFAYLGAYGGLLVIDVSNPANPNDTSFYHPPQFSLFSGYSNVKVLGNESVIIASTPSTFDVIDITNPAIPDTIPVYYNTDLGAIEMLVDTLEDKVYLINDYKITVIDISNPRAPRIERQVSTSINSPFHATIFGNYIYLGALHGLYILDKNTLQVVGMDNGDVDKVGNVNDIIVEGCF